MNKVKVYMEIKNLKKSMETAAYAMDDYGYFEAVGYDVELACWAIERDLKHLKSDIILAIIDYCYQQNMLQVFYLEACEIAKELFQIEN